MKRQFYLLIFLSFVFTGCVKKWLELEPKAEVSADVLLQSPEGFSVALNGIYTNLSSKTLYGGELLNGMVEVLGRCYELKNTTPYDDLKTYNYSANSIQNILNSIWALSYNTIANCNGLLEEMNKKPAGFFKEHERARLEGELLSIRAMLHFELLRLYAPAPAVQDAEAIPYYTTLSYAPLPERRTSEILQWIIDDLTRSKQLQKEFDTRIEARHDFNEFRFKLNKDKTFFGTGLRGFRMGYYATSALLSRVALYAGNEQLAYDNAMEVINEKSVDNEPLVSFTPATVIDVGEYDRLLSDDILFALYRIDYEEEFNNITCLSANTTQIFGSDINSDYRRKCYLSPSGTQLLKYDIEQGAKREGQITSIIPAFRLSELYHIAAESLFDRDPDGALTLLNTLRTKRGCTVPLPSISSKSAFQDALINDARREFIGEGKLFFMYKRLNKTVLDETLGNQTLDDKFILPVTER
jgi:SusD family.